jgi:hypothetical protein
MAAGVADKLWDMSDLVAIVEAADAKPVCLSKHKAKAKTT